MERMSIKRMAYEKSIKERACVLRREGNTYTEIKKLLKVNIPKSTLSEWFHTMKLSRNEEKNISFKMRSASENGRRKALKTNMIKQEKHLGKFATASLI